MLTSSAWAISVHLVLKGIPPVVLDQKSSELFWVDSSSVLSFWTMNDCLHLLSIELLFCCFLNCRTLYIFWEPVFCHYMYWLLYKYPIFKIFFDVDCSLKSLLNLLQYCFCFMFWFFGYEAHGILALQPGIEPTPCALEGTVLTTGPTGKSLRCLF